MAFDLASFDLSGFDVGGEGIVLFSALAQEKITAVIGTSQEIYFAATGSARINAERARGGNGIFISGSGAEAVTEASATGDNSVMIGTMAGVESTAAEVVCRSTNWLRITGTESASAEAAPGSDIFVTGAAAERTAAEVYNEKETRLTIAAYELMSASATLEAVDIETCELNLRLEPGQRLVVDAKNYYVWLDGENAIESRKGVWLDKMSRNTTSISITAASGVANLEASILYTEQYL